MRSGIVIICSQNYGLFWNTIIGYNLLTMADMFAIVQLKSGFVVVVSRKQIIGRYDDMAYVSLLGERQKVQILGFHRNYDVLNEIADTINGDKFKIVLSNIFPLHNVIQEDITPTDQPIRVSNEPPRIVKKKFSVNHTDSGDDQSVIEHLKTSVDQLCIPATFSPHLDSSSAPSLAISSFLSDSSSNVKILQDVVVLPPPLHSIDNITESLPNKIVLALPESTTTTQITPDITPYFSKCGSSSSWSLFLPECDSKTDSSSPSSSLGKNGPVTSTPYDSRVKKKRNHCLYCSELKTDLARHLLSQHAEERDVINYRLLTGVGKKQKLAQLRRDGNFQAMMCNKNDMVLSRRRNKHVNLKDYVACPECKILIKRTSLYRHVKVSCSIQTKCRVGALMLASTLVDTDFQLEASDTFKNFIFPKFREGPIKDFIQQDILLITYANHLCAKYRDQHHYAMIRNRLILVTKCLMEAKKLDPSITDFQSLLTPDKYKLIEQCVNILGCYNPETHFYAKPSLPTSLGTYLKYVIKLLRNRAIERRDDTMRDAANDLYGLLETRLAAFVNKTANESLLQSKRQKTQHLPVMEDIQLLNKYVLENRNFYYKKLLENFDLQYWRQLLNYTLISILIFNRRRPGELERALLNDLKLSLTDFNQQNIPKNLSNNAKNTLLKYKRFAVRGKLSRGVPVLLHNSMYRCIELILKHRGEAGVLSDNFYIFGLPQKKIDGKSTIYRHALATDLIREYAVKCGATYSQRLRATRLRKHIATMSLDLNLTDNEVSRLQNFMGHEDKIHKEYYRQPVVVHELTEISQLLKTAQGGYIDLESSGMAESSNSDTQLDDTPIFQHSRNYSGMKCDDVSDVNDCIAIATTSTTAVATTSTTAIATTSTTAIATTSTTAIATTSTTAIATTSNACQKPNLSNMVEDDSGDSNISFISEPKTPDIDPNYEVDDISSDISSTWSTPPKRKRLRAVKIIRRRTWNTPEKHTMRTIFGEYLEKNTLPKLKDCHEALHQYASLKNRTAEQMIMWIKNENNKRHNKNSNEPKRLSWTTPERHALVRHFQHHIEGKTYPSFAEIDGVLAKEPNLKNRDPRNIRSQIQNRKKLYLQNLSH